MVMCMSSPDFQLPVSFQLACELGLEESVLITYLRQKSHHLGSKQMKFSHRDLGDMLPFWTGPYVVRLLTSLQMAQMLSFRRTEAGLEVALDHDNHTRETADSKRLDMRTPTQQDDAVNKLTRLQQEASQRQETTYRQEASQRLEPSQRDTVQAHFSQRPRVSATELKVPSPVAMSSSVPMPQDRRGLSDFDLYLEAKERTRQPDQWLPEDATFEQIQQAGIERAFAESLLAEFLLRIKEQRKNVRTWNSEFFKYVKRQWQYKQSDRQSYEGTATYTANAKSNREQVSNALTNIHDTDW